MNYGRNLCWCREKEQKREGPLVSRWWDVTFQRGAEVPSIWRGRSCNLKPGNRTPKSLVFILYSLLLRNLTKVGFPTVRWDIRFTKEIGSDHQGKCDITDMWEANRKNWISEKLSKWPKPGRIQSWTFWTPMPIFWMIVTCNIAPASLSGWFPSDKDTFCQKPLHNCKMWYKSMLYYTATAYLASL